MFKAKIFLVGKDEEDLTPMEETAYETEDVLQIALERYPDLLPGDQINPEAPRRWLLVAREMGIPGEIDAADRWSLDHLFLDQDGRPTFVECKRASDTRSRREVIAQMLDYAANGTAYWGANRLRQLRPRQRKPAASCWITKSADSFRTGGGRRDWQTVEENLKKARSASFSCRRHPPRITPVGGLSGPEDGRCRGVCLAVGGLSGPEGQEPASVGAPRDRATGGRWCGSTHPGPADPCPVY